MKFQDAKQHVSKLAEVNVTVALTDVGLPNAGLDVTNVAVGVDDGTASNEKDDPASIAVHGTASVRGASRSVLLAAVWSRGQAETPDVALAVKATSTKLSALNASWDGAVDPTFSRAWMVVTPSATAISLDPRRLPTPVAHFFGADEAAMSLSSAVVNFRGDMDAAASAGMEKMSAFLAVSSPIRFHGELAKSGSALFSSAPAADLATVELRAALQPTATLPAWMTSRSSSLKLMTNGSGTDQSQLTDTFTLTAGGTANQFQAASVDVNGTRFKAAPVTISYKPTGAFSAPFGAGWLKLSDVSFDVTLPSAGSHTGKLNAKLETQPDATVGLSIDLQASDQAVTGSFSLADGVTLADVLRLLGGLVDTSTFTDPGTLSLRDVKFSFTSTAGSEGFSLSALATARGTEVDVLVSARKIEGKPILLLGAHPRSDMTLPSLLGATLPFPVADLKLGKPNLTVVQGATSLAASGLTGAEKEYFEQVYGAGKLPGELTFIDGLNLTASVPLDSLGAGVREALGYAEKSVVLLHGTLGFTFKAFGGSDKLGVTGVSLSARLPSLTPAFPEWMKLQTASPPTVGLSYDSVRQALELSTTSVVDVTLGKTTFKDVSVTSAFTRTAAIGNLPATTVQQLTAALGAIDDPFGQTWVDLTSAKLSATLKVPDTGSRDLAASVMGSVTLDELGSFSVEITGISSDGTSGRVLASTELDLSLGRFAEFFDSFAETTYGVTLKTTVPTDLRSLTLNKATISAVGPAEKRFTIAATTSFAPASKALSAHARIMIAPGRLLVGLSRPDNDTSLSEVVSGLPHGVDLTFPAFGVVLAKPALPDTAFSALTPDEFDFFNTFYGCAFDYELRGNCQGSVSAPEGMTMVASTRLPDGLKPVVKQLGIHDAAPLLVRGTVPIFGGPDISLHVQLPPIAVPANDFVNSASLSLDVTPQGFSMAGRLGLQFRHGDQPLNRGGTCQLPTQALTSAADSKTYCYDVLTFTVAASVVVSPSPKVEVTGSLRSEGGWKAPFGVSWLEIKNVTMKFGVTANPNLAVTLGFGGAVKLGDKDIDAAMLLDVNLATGIPVPSLQGVRAASTAGLSLSDLTSLAGAVSGTSISTSDLGLPNIAVRNLKFAFSRVEDTDLCLTPGIKFGGDLYISSSTIDRPSDDQATNVAAVGKCLQLPVEKVDAPTEDCKANKANGCFASVLSRVDQNGLSAAGFIGGFSLSPFKWDDAKAVLELSANRQRVGVSGGMHIGADGARFADGTVDLDFQTSGMSFRGDVELFGGTFAAYLYGSGSSFNLTSPPNFDATLVLRSDFSSAVSAALSPTLKSAGQAVMALNKVFQALEDPFQALQALRSLPNTLATVGVDTPQWLKDFVSQAATIDSNIARYGTGTNSVGTVLSGIEFPSLAGVEGAWVPPSTTCSGVWDGGSCYLVPPVCVEVPLWGTECSGGVPGLVVHPGCTGTVHNGTCYFIPPLPSFSVGGLCSQVGLPKCDLETLLREKVNPLLSDALRKLTGLGSSATFDLGTFLQKLSTTLGGTDVLNVKCAEFTGKLGTLANAGAGVNVSMKLSVFGTDVSFGVKWDFKASTVANNARGSLLSIANQVLTPQPVACTGLPAGVGSDAPPAGGGTGGTTAASDLGITLDKTRVTENDKVQLTGRFTDKVTSARSVIIDWGDGTATQTIRTSTAEFTASHQYLDNTPAGVASATYQVTATAQADLKIPKRTKVVTVDNAAPKDVALVFGSAPKEGEEVTLNGSFTDVGTQDVHKVEIDWGDGSANAVMNLTGERAFAPKHTYADNGSYTVSVVVSDEDGGSGTKTLSVVVTNVAPSAVTLTPCRLLTSAGGECTPNLAIAEGDVVLFTGTFTDPGTADGHTVVIDWGDGSTPTTLSLSGYRTFSVAHRYLDNPPDQPAGEFAVKVTVTDDDKGEGSLATTVPVPNVAPGSLQSILHPVSIAESGTVAVGGAFVDPGDDTHTVVIDWGAGWPVDERMQTLHLNRGDRLFQASRKYGDNGTFAVKITVADDDTGQTDTTREATVINLPPTAVVDDSVTAGTVMSGGVPTFMARAGETLSFNATGTDAGSDDVTARWDWADGTVTTTPFLANGPGTDPLPSPQVGPRQIRDEQSHGWQEACLYQPTFMASDDDGGASAADSFRVVIRGTATQAEPAGYWQTQYGTARVGGALSPKLLSCYLQVVGHISTVFDEARDASTPARAFDVLNPAASPPARDLLDRELLAAWLNFAHGVFDLDQLVDANGDRVADTPFSAVMAHAEAVRKNGSATSNDLRAQAELLRRINTPSAP